MSTGTLIPHRNMTVPAVAQSVSPGIFMQGPGGLFAVPLCQRYGRYVVADQTFGKKKTHIKLTVNLQTASPLLVAAPVPRGDDRCNIRPGLC
jgi:hypothetical protein